MLRVLVLALVLMVAIVALVPRRTVPPPEAATEWPAARALPAITFVDQDGQPFTSAQLTERFTLLFFGFTHCPDVCPMSMAVLARAIDQLRASRTPPPRVVLVSVDPERDTPERLRSYLANFDDEFIGLTAEESQLEPLWQALGVTVIRQSLGDRQYTVTHNPQVYVLAPSGEVFATLNSAGNADSVVRDYQRIRVRYLSGAGPL